MARIDQNSGLVSRLWELAHRDPTVNVARWSEGDKRVFDRCSRRFGKDFAHDLVKRARLDAMCRAEGSPEAPGQIKVFIEELGEPVWVQITSGDERCGVGYLHGTPKNPSSCLCWGDEIEFAGGGLTRHPRFVRSTGRRVEHCGCPLCRPDFN